MSHANLLGRVPLFSGLSVEDREALALRLETKTFRARESVFEKGAVGDALER